MAVAEAGLLPPCPSTAFGLRACISSRECRRRPSSQVRRAHAQGALIALPLGTGGEKSAFCTCLGLQVWVRAPSLPQRYGCYDQCLGGSWASGPRQSHLLLRPFHCCGTILGEFYSFERLFFYFAQFCFLPLPGFCICMAVGNSFSRTFGCRQRTISSLCRAWARNFNTVGSSRVCGHLSEFYFPRAKARSSCASSEALVWTWATLVLFAMRQCSLSLALDAPEITPLLRLFFRLSGSVFELWARYSFMGI